MFISTTTVIALCCPHCGKMEYNAVSLFQFSGRKSVTLKCSCGTFLGQLSSKDHRSFSLEFTCGMCTGTHIYNFSRKILWSKSATTIFCVDTDLEAGFAGRKEAVKSVMKELERSVAQLASELGYDDNFDNPEIMYTILEHLYSIVEKGNLRCQCGNADVELEIFPDMVEVKCSVCDNSDTISALDGEDLRRIEHLDKLLLTAQGLLVANTVRFGSRKNRNKK